MRLPNAAHEAHPWVISRIAPDFTLLDVWALPVHGGPDEFDSLIERVGPFDPTHADSVVTRALFCVRLRLGALLGWDDADKKRPIPGCRETSLVERLPGDLRESVKTPAIAGALQRVAGGFVPLYRTDDEWAAEISNDTVHGVLQLAWVEEGDGRYRAQMGVYVKPRGRLGELYMKVIAPFRHLIVYPALMRQIGRAWDGRDMATTGPRDPHRT
jgi:uncharacterized protein DUF2867